MVGGEGGKFHCTSRNTFSDGTNMLDTERHAKAYLGVGPMEINGLDADLSWLHVEPIKSVG